MKMFLAFAAGLALMLGAGCTTTDRYPVSGEKCNPDDPVKGMSAPECIEVTAS
jgi:hypothetical protein